MTKPGQPAAAGRGESPRLLVGRGGAWADSVTMPQQHWPHARPQSSRAEMHGELVEVLEELVARRLIRGPLPKEAGQPKTRNTALCECQGS